LDIVHHAMRAFGQAGIGAESWRHALNALSLATGSRGGQMIGLGGASAVPFNYTPELPEEATEEFLAVGGGDPKVNPRIRAGIKAPMLASLAEADFTSSSETPRSDYTDFIERLDIPFICLTTLVRDESMAVGLSVLRTQKQGHITGEQQRSFDAIAPHVRRAVHLQVSLRDQSAQILAGALENLNIEAFVVDAWGRVRAMSRTAEERLRSQVHLAARGKRLTARDPEAARQLESAILRAASPALDLDPPPPFIVAQASGGQDPLVLEVSPVARGISEFGDGLALVVARSPRNLEGRLAELSRALYALTPTEAAVASALAAGGSPQAVADRMQVSIGTVRTHIRRVFDKAGVHSLLELASKFMGRL
jgi:DNA-binding CsgD family transcriptional regulator